MLQSLEISNAYHEEDGVPFIVKSIKWLSHLTSLKRLVMTNIDLSKATDWIQSVNNLPSLTYLDLSDSNLPNFMPSPLLRTNFSKSLAFVDLSNNQLKASSVWTWLFNHSSLVEIYLSRNQLEGPIPSAFRSTTSLSHLDLSTNQLFGPIPSGFRNMTSLSHLDLSTNQLFGPIPSGFRNMTSLSHLDLSTNQVIGPIPIGFRNMTSLSHLDLSSNHLKGEFSYSIEGLCSIQRLDLSRNELTGDLGSIFQSLSCSAESLTFLSLRHNRLTGSFPNVSKLDGVRKLWSLAVLNLQSNQLTGSVPDVSAFRSLKRLQLQNNKLNGTIHVSLGRLSSLVKLDISKNSLKGRIFAGHLSNLSSLQYLDMSFNSLSFNISSNWVPPFRLKTIGLAYCNLGPHFPEWLQTQRDYRRLDMSIAGISGTIPLWFWNLSSLATFIGLSRNQLQGTLPSSSILYVQNIDLSSNHLEGSIPSFLGNAAYLNLSRNSFSGPISTLCQQSEIYESVTLAFDLSHNNLSGKFPSCLMKFGFEVLDLSNNNFSGNVSTIFNFDHIRNLLSLHLENNRLSGKLPLLEGGKIDLHYLDLGGNLFSGEIPKWTGHMLPNLITLSLGNNFFSGSIPSQLCHLTTLQILDLSMNNLSEDIPTCLCNLTAMTQKYKRQSVDFSLTNSTFASIGSPYKDYISIGMKGFIYEYKNNLELVKSIDLSSNKLRGKIPAEISCLTGLVSLNLSRNILNGSITSGIGQLTSLESLDLSENHLSGEIPVTISSLHFLSSLNLADNNLFGRIPTGTQIQGFNASVFEGNTGLCGQPLPKNCLSDDGGGGESSDGSEGGSHGEFDQHLRLYISTILGFITGFWGVCGALVVKRSWRHAYFRFWIHIYDKLYVIIVLAIARR